MSEVMCKGDFSLGTACGNCSRCIEADKKFSPSVSTGHPAPGRVYAALAEAQRLRADTAALNGERK